MIPGIEIRSLPGVLFIYLSKIIEANQKYNGNSSSVIKSKPNEIENDSINKIPEV